MTPAAPTAYEIRSDPSCQSDQAVRHDHPEPHHDRPARPRAARRRDDRCRANGRLAFALLRAWPGSRTRSTASSPGASTCAASSAPIIDPLADKALLVSIYVTLAVLGMLPGWLAIVVVSRDVMIVAAIAGLVADGPAGRRSSRSSISKLNTAAQIAFAALVLGAMAFGGPPASGSSAGVRPLVAP